MGEIPETVNRAILRDRRRRQGEPNPFVVLADITIALSFVFLLFASFTFLNSTRIIQELSLAERQGNAGQRIVQALKNVPGFAPFDTVPPEGFLADPQPSVVLLASKGSKRRPLGRVDVNGSFLRVRFYERVFRVPKKGRSGVSDSKVSELGLKLYKALFDCIRTADPSQPKAVPIGQELAYVFLHGVSRSGSNPLNTSQERAFMVRDSLLTRSSRDLRAIAGPGEEDAGELAPVLLPSGRLRYSRVTPYGTGEHNYVTKDGPVGPKDERVDVVLFFGDYATNHKDATVASPSWLPLPFGGPRTR